MAGEPLVLIATFGAPHGVRGEVRVKSHASSPEALMHLSPLVARDGRTFTVTHVRPAGEVVIARVAELSDRTAAEGVTRVDLFVPRDRLPPPEDDDEFLHADLIGLKVETVSGEPIGTVIAVHDFGAGAMLDIARPGKRSVLAPFTRQIVPTVDLAGGRVVLDPPENLLRDDDRPPPEEMAEAPQARNAGPDVRRGKPKGAPGKPAKGGPEAKRGPEAKGGPEGKGAKGGKGARSKRRRVEKLPPHDGTWVGAHGPRSGPKAS